MASEMPQQKTARELADAYQGQSDVCHQTLIVEIGDDEVTKRMSVWVDEETSRAIVDMYARGLRQIGFETEISVADDTDRWWIKAEH